MTSTETALVQNNSPASTEQLGLGALLPACGARQPAENNRYLNSKLKRGMDLSVALLLLCFLAPLLMLIALAVKATSPGPVLFRQWRNGAGLRPFQIYKFRSMYVTEANGSVRQAIRYDARVTPLGALLRRTSMDELPQLLNVLKGDMSLVGPRPHAVCHDEHYSGKVSRYLDRFAARPGLTGLAQVNGARGETPRTEDMQRRINWDIRYIGTASSRLDLAILLKTAREVSGSSSAF
jgi:putative colanic acid biosysnthesis UDP-glucose lipid carrier transferase